MSGYQEVSEYLVVKQVVDAARWILDRPAEHKEPLSAALGQKAISHLEKGNFGDLQLAALLSLGFFGFLWWDDFNHLSVDSFYFTDSRAAIFWKNGRMISSTRAQGFCIAHCSTPPCPVEIAEKFLRIANHSKDSLLFWCMLHTLYQERSLSVQRLSLTAGLRSWSRRSLAKRVWTPQSLESIVQRKLLHQRLSVYQTDSSKDMEGGEERRLWLIT